MSAVLLQSPVSCPPGRWRWHLGLGVGRARTVKAACHGEEKAASSRLRCAMDAPSFLHLALLLRALDGPSARRPTKDMRSRMLQKFFQDHVPTGADPSTSLDDAMRTDIGRRIDLR